MTDAPLAWLVAIAMAFAPPLLGVAAGHAARRLSLIPRRALVLAVVAAAVFAPIAVATRYTPINPFDLWFVGALFVLGFAGRAWPRARRPIARGTKLLAAGSVVAVVVAAELVLRAGGSAERPLRPPDRQPLVVDLKGSEFGCRPLFPKLDEGGWFARFGGPDAIPRKPGRRRVLHLGDSVLESTDEGIRDGDVFTALLDTPGEEHLNLGVANTGPDLQLLLLRRWLPILQPDAVVLHSYPGNDLGDIDRPFACAGAQPLLEYPDTGAPRARFHEPAWRLTLARSLELWPPPYALRIFGSLSDAARSLVWRIAERFHGGEFYYVDETRWLHYERIMTAFRDEVGRAGIPLRVVVLHDPERLEDIAIAARGTNGRRMLRTLERLRVFTLDPASALQAAARADPKTPVLLPASPHFSAAGHRVFADWLREHLDLGAEPAR